MPKVRTLDLIKKFNLEVISGDEEVHRPIVTSDISRPGIELAGFFTYYPAERLQLLGKTELSFFENLPHAHQKERMLKLCHMSTPGIVISRSQHVPEALIEASKENGVPVIRSQMTTTKLSSRITSYLESALAPTTAVHGVLVDIYGVGVLITGDSGVGKSETALELVKRGHRLVADDSVEIRQEHENTLVGEPPELIKHLLEIRGLGIINMMTLFGARAIRNYKKISLVVHLELWDEDKEYDRLGLDEQHMKILDTDLPKLIIPVRPGRNLAVIAEVAAMNFRLKKMGMNAAQEFSDRLNNVMDEQDWEDM